MNLQRLTPLRFEWNSWNGFIISVFGIEYQGKNKGFEGEFFGIHFSKKRLIIYVMFIEFDIKSPIV